MIEVTDVNDNAPIFTSPNYHVHVMEGSFHDDVILLLKANDADSEKYSQIKYRYCIVYTPFIKMTSDN